MYLCANLLEDSGARHLPRLRAELPHGPAVGAPPCPLQSVEKQELISGAWGPPSLSRGWEQAQALGQQGQIFTPTSTKSALGRQEGGITWSRQAGAPSCPQIGDRRNICLVSGEIRELKPRAGKAWPRIAPALDAKRSCAPGKLECRATTQGLRAPLSLPQPAWPRAEGDQGNQGLSWHHLAQWT